MLKQDILWVGIGEAGGRLIDEVCSLDNKYVGLAINTSSTDMEKLSHVKNQYLIPNARGTGRDRNKAKVYCKDHYQAIVEQINNFTSQKVINVVFSLSGGTGSGTTPTIIRVLDQLGSDKVINVIGILPSTNESKKALENTIEAWNETIRLSKMVSSTMFIDNECGKSLQEVNAEFAEIYNKVMEIPEQISSEHAQIDDSDLESVLLAKGYTVMYISDSSDNFEQFKKEAIEDSVLAKPSNFKGTHLVMSLETLDSTDIQKEFKSREDYFIGGNEFEDVIVLSGLKPPAAAIELIKTELEYKKSESEYESEEDLEEFIIEVRDDKAEEVVTTKQSSKKKELKDKRKMSKKILDKSFWDEEIFN